MNNLKIQKAISKLLNKSVFDVIFNESRIISNNLVMIKADGIWFDCDTSDCSVMESI
jgi:hypothetical protein